MTYNLLFDPMFPVVRKNGAKEMVGFTALTSQHDTNPIMSLAFGTAGLDAAATEFLIGLRHIIRPINEDRPFSEEWQTPPTQEQLEKDAEPFRSFFNVLGNGPAVFQDKSLLGEEGAEPVPLITALIEGPSAGSANDNSDIFVKVDSLPYASPQAAFAILASVNAYCGVGGGGKGAYGDGYKKSSRGGGSMTTLIGAPNLTLWQFITVNCPEEDETREPAAACPEKIAPWFWGPGGEEFSPETTHPAAVFFLQSRRYALVVDENVAKRVCPITGEVPSHIVTGILRGVGGNSYDGFRHPLSPYRISAKGGKSPVKCAPSGIPFTHWPELFMGADKTEPAAIVPVALRRLQQLGMRQPEMIALGYALASTGGKALAFNEARLPAFYVEKHADVFAAVAARWAAGTALLLSVLEDGVLHSGKSLNTAAAVKTARKAFRGSTAAAGVRSQFYLQTEAAFYSGLNSLLGEFQSDDAVIDEVVSVVSETYLAAISDESRKVFRMFTPEISALSSTATRTIAQKNKLEMVLSGFDKRLIKALGVEKKKKAQKIKEAA